MEFLARLPHIRSMHLLCDTDRRGSLRGRISVLLFDVAYSKLIGIGVAPTNALLLPCLCHACAPLVPCDCPADVS